jgi:hypothetical protein
LVEVKSEDPARPPGARDVALALLGGVLGSGLVAFLGPATDAWLRAGPAFGAAFLLARRLGLGRTAAGFTGLSFGGSAAVVLGAPAGRSPAPELDLVQVGLVLVVVALVLGWRRAPAPGWLGRVSIPCVAALLLAVAWAFGAPWLAVVHGAAGRPDAGGYVGFGDHDLRVAPWVTTATLTFALASALSTEGRLVGRAAIAALGLIAWLAAVGGGVPVGAASLPAALFLALLAGDGLESAPRRARAVAVLTVAGLSLWVTGADDPLLDRPTVPGDPPDELVILTTPPASRKGVVLDLSLAGRIHADVPAADVRVFAERERGGAFERAPAAIEVETTRGARGELSFRSAASTQLTSDTWRWAIEVLGEDGEVIGARATRSFAVVHEPLPDPFTLLALAGLALVAAFARAGSRVQACVVVPVALLQVADLVTPL